MQLFQVRNVYALHAAACAPYPRAVPRSSRPVSRKDACLVPSAGSAAMSSSGPSDACCAAGKPVVAEYEPIGKMKEIEDQMDYYHVGSGPAGVVIVTDIFGLAYKQVFQVADRLAAAGLNVVVPDVFNGLPWTKDKFPPKPEHNFMGWITTEGSWDKVGPHLHASAEVLRQQGATKLGVIGFCWGVSIAMRAGEDPAFSAVGGAHPALFGRDVELAERLQCPVILLPAKDDAPESKVKDITDTKPFGHKCVFQRFDDQTHGFVAARGDWSQPEVAAAATKAIDLMAAFLTDNLA